MKEAKKPVAVEIDGIEQSGPEAGNQSRHLETSSPWFPNQWNVRQ
jgi:hypothetical protein